MTSQENTNNNSDSNQTQEGNSSLKRAAHNLFKKYEDRLPIVINKEPSSTLPVLEKKKYLVPHNLTVGSLMVTIRNKISLPNYKTLFLVTKEGNYVPSSTETMAEIYQKYQSEDGFLYFDYKGENAFGYLF